MSKVNKIVIDAIFINEGGGKVLLDYLFEQLDLLNKKNIIFLIDKRIESDYKNKKSNHITIEFLQGFVERNSYFKKNKNNFSKVLCFGNIPPNIRLEAEVYTYFHQPMYLNIPKNFNLLERFKFKLKVLVLRKFSKNTDFWLVQNDTIKSKFQIKFDEKSEKVIKLPFYPPLFTDVRSSRIPNSFIYVSNATPHKNHKNLIDGFCKFYDKYKLGKLTLTVSKDYTDIYEYCNRKKKQGYPIINIGFVERSMLAEYYNKSTYLVFPSLEESFGLGIVEAIDCGCNVIGADLPYMYAVCNPSIVFNPHSSVSICEAFEKTINLEVVKSKKNVENDIKKLIKLLIKS